MSKRTNAFQKTILFIHDQLKDSQTKVIESALLPERNIEPIVYREIDVLIEKEEEGRTLRIALECRDRSHKDEIGWIDSLIGKYLNLQVDKVIAVSSSGFSKQAKLKAKTNNIELRALSEIKTIDWNKEFKKLGMCDWQLSFTIQKVIAETESGVDIQMEPKLKINCAGQSGDFEEFFKAFNENLWNNLFKNKFNESIPKFYKSKEDLSKTAIIEHRVPVSDIQVIAGKMTYNIIAFKLFIVGIPKVNELDTKQFRYLDAVISKTNLTIDNNKSMTFYTSQVKPNQIINISIDKKRKNGHT